MSYIKTKNRQGQVVIKGSYQPSGHTCKCKECKFEIELPCCVTDEQIDGLIAKLKELIE